MNLEASREAFEAWLSSQRFFDKARMRLTRTGNGPYHDFRVNDRWNAWCAALDYAKECL